MDHFLEEIKRYPPLCSYVKRHLTLFVKGTSEPRNEVWKTWYAHWPRVTIQLAITFEIAAQGRSVTSMAAYEGQSGSKDRGDPEVRIPLIVIAR